MTRMTKGAKKCTIAHIEIAALLNSADDSVKNFFDLLLGVCVHQLATSSLGNSGQNGTFRIFRRDGEYHGNPNNIARVRKYK